MIMRRMTPRRLTSFLALLVVFFLSHARGQESPSKPTLYTYKTIQNVSLKAHVYSPPGAKGPRAAVVLFHGGGWVVGTPEWTPARDIAARGVVAISVEYRLSDRKTVTPLDAVEDARDAIKWVRKNSEMLGIDPRRVAAWGISAGGHLAAFAAVSGDADSKPNALILWSPAVSLSSDPYFKGLLGARAQASDLSPDEHVRSDMAPAIVISGSDDPMTPEAGARRYCARVKEVGGRCELHIYPGLGHLLTRKIDHQAQLRGDFDFDPKATADADTEIWKFLEELGYLTR
jgi:acetyl esterase/lipase